jgi:hypothetical protein
MYLGKRDTLRSEIDQLFLSFMNQTTSRKTTLIVNILKTHVLEPLGGVGAKKTSFIYSGTSTSVIMVPIPKFDSVHVGSSRS